jgi:hypothetical protein
VGLEACYQYDDQASNGTTPHKERAGKSKTDSRGEQHDAKQDEGLVDGTLHGHAFAPIYQACVQYFAGALSVSLLLHKGVVGGGEHVSSCHNGEYFW